MTNQASKSVALLGGSFDPPHQAHLQVIQYLQNLGRFDEIWIIPAGAHPFKRATADYQARLKMCRLAFDHLGPQVKVSEEDRDSSGYTIDLIQRLRNDFPKHRFTFVGGSDLKDEMAKWKEPEALKKTVEFLFLPRPPESDSIFADISSTQIRERLKNRLPITSLLPKAVEDYIREKGLYLS